jgi:hypothetical protein
VFVTTLVYVAVESAKNALPAGASVVTEMSATVWRGGAGGAGASITWVVAGAVVVLATVVVLETVVVVATVVVVGTVVVV